MNDKINKISVVMTSYNGEKYIREQLDSIITNITENDELIIGDDGSTDNTISIIDEYLDKFPHIKLVKSQKLGTTNNLERLISMTNGDIIFIADQDDVWDSQKVSKICNAFQDNWFFIIQRCLAQILTIFCIFLCLIIYLFQINSLIISCIFIFGDVCLRSEKEQKNTSSLLDLGSIVG